MEKTPEKSQFVHFSFYKLSRAWWQQPDTLQQSGYQAFLDVIQSYEKRIFIQPYSLFGIRAEVDFMLWKASYCLEDFQALASDLVKTPLGKYLETPYAYFSMTRHSQYVEGHLHEGQESKRLKIMPGEHKYLCVYPFVKTNEWYQLPFPDRQKMMEEHFAIGHKYPNIKIHTTYSFGLDDQEFVLAFETDDLTDFLKLIMELRESVARPYTLRDTPIFTCIHTTKEKLIP